MDPEPTFVERQVEVGTVVLNYAEGADNGTPLLLLHGGSARWQSWDPVIGPLAARAHVFALDLRGHGGSSWTPGAYRLVGFAADVEAFIHDVIGQPAIVLGHSLGGEIALIAASERPDLTRAVIDEDGPPSAEAARRMIDPTRPTLEAMRSLAGSTLPDDELSRRVGEMPVAIGRGTERFGDFLGWDRDALVFSGEMLRRNDPAMIDAVIGFEEMHAGFGDRVLERIACPVVILQADPGLGGLPDDAIEHALSVIADSRRVRFEGLGHAIHMDDPERFLEVVIPLLEDFG